MESHRRVLSRGVPRSGFNRQTALLATTVRLLLWPGEARVLASTCGNRGSERRVFSKSAVKGVSVCPSCCNRTPQTGWLTNNRNVFLIVLEAEVWDQGACLVGWGLVYRLSTSSSVLTCWKGLGSSLGSPLIRAQIQFMRACSWGPHPYDLNTS